MSGSDALVGVGGRGEGSQTLRASRKGLPYRPAFFREPYFDEQVKKVDWESATKTALGDSGNKFSAKSKGNGGRV